MNGQSLRQHFYDHWGGHSVSFETVTGERSCGTLGNWLDDGTLLFTSLCFYDVKGKCVDFDGGATLFNFAQIRMISSIWDLPEDLINAAMTKEWEREERREEMRLKNERSILIPLC